MFFFLFCFVLQNVCKNRHGGDYLEFTLHFYRDCDGWTLRRAKTSDRSLTNGHSFYRPDKMTFRNVRTRTGSIIFDGGTRRRKNVKPLWYSSEREWLKIPLKLFAVTQQTNYLEDRLPRFKLEEKQNTFSLRSILLSLVRMQKHAKPTTRRISIYKLPLQSFQVNLQFHSSQYNWRKRHAFFVNNEKNFEYSWIS